jgi:ABC-2 type transport system permease protein
MFSHIYVNRLKCIIRDKQMMFWTLLFPILLATLFNMAFANISSSEQFTKIKIAVVQNAEFKNTENFRKALDSVSNSAKNASTSNLFTVNYTSKNNADLLLENSKIDGYIYFKNGLNLIVKQSAINQTIIKGFLDDYKQSSSTIGTIFIRNPNAGKIKLLNDISSRKEYLKEVSASKSTPDTIVNYFYSLIAMACLYGSFWGLKEVIAIQANLSAAAARVNMAPTHKLKVFAISMLAATTVQLTEIFVLLLYLILILKIDFGNQINYIALTCVIGTLTGVTFGAFIAAVIKKGEGIKIAILISFTMAMSFLSGMMYANMKYIISTNYPILGYLNPANLITDSFYSLYYYNTHTQFYTDLILLCGFTIVFSLVTYFVLRRQKYANL